MRILSNTPLKVENSQGNTYYLHHKGRFYYFSKKSSGATSKPSGATITEARTGLPLLKGGQR